MIHTEYFENVTLSPRLFRAFYLCCAALAKATQGEGFANRCAYVFIHRGMLGTLPYLRITAVRYGNTTEIYINDKYYRNVKI